MMPSEFALIQSIQQQIKINDERVITGIGDDCAVVLGRAGFYMLLTTDSLVEDVHFCAGNIAPEQLGFKALAVNLSDVAAMGGVPLYVLVSLGLPPSLPAVWIKEFYGGMDQLARQHRVSIVGGNISSAEKLHIHITLVGEVKRAHCKWRKGARDQDRIYVTGPMGGAALALKEKKYLAPPVRVREGQDLGSLDSVTSMTDVSDGLLADLQHILDASGCGAILQYDAIPKPDSSGLIPDMVLSGGEDYELLFTAAENFNSMENPGVWCIGRMTHDRGLSVLDKDGSPIKVEGRGFDHFRP